jgi:hypothetical protein
MSLATEAGQDDQRLRRYLLGLLADDEAERLDEASIADDGVAARLQGAEHDLVDEYVTGALDPPTRERFESFYLASPLRRTRVHGARRFLAAVDRAAARVTAATSSTVLQREPVRRRAMLGWTAAAAFASVVIASAVLFLLDTPGGTARVTPVAPTASRIGASPPAAPLDQHVIVLSPDVRSAEPLPIVTVGGASHVRFDLRLESVDFAEYVVTLRNAPGHVVWRHRGDVPQKGPEGTVIRMAVPANVLAVDRYSFEVAGVRPEGPPDPVATYTVRIGSR